MKMPTKMVVGPATHCEWTTVQNETGFDIVVEELRFFDYWLKGINNGVMSEAAGLPTTRTTRRPVEEWQTRDDLAAAERAAALTTI